MNLPENRSLPPDPHWALSILATILVFPFGFIALVFSFVCVNCITAEKYDMAYMYSRYAKNTAITCLIVAAAFAVVALLFIIAGVALLHGVTSNIATTTIP
jgi:hypothetical protein